jgi:ATP-dependent exoDNAse (exonuclease V) alpha subunit
VTSHSSQGKSVDRVFVGQSSQSFPATSREQFYVSCSRGRESVTVYCDDKEALSEAVEQSDERISATELIKGSRQRSIVALHERYHEPSPERKQVEREGLSYDR